MHGHFSFQHTRPRPEEVDLIELAPDDSESTLNGMGGLVNHLVTYNTNRYGFYLTNLNVACECGDGYPVGHFITSRQDSTTIEFCLKELLRN